MIKIEAVKKLLKQHQKSRPVLACINYNENSIQFTNSYSLVEITTSKQQPMLLDPFTMLQVEGLQYPSLDRIKPSQLDLQGVNNIKIEALTNQGKTELFYNVDGIYFNKDLLDTTFKTVNLDLLKDVNREYHLYIKNNKTNGLLIYKKQNVYILVLSIKKEIDEV
jgi:hypothetical protein